MDDIDSKKKSASPLKREIANVNIRPLIVGMLWLILCSAILRWYVFHPLSWVDPAVRATYDGLMNAISFPAGPLFQFLLKVIDPLPGFTIGRELELTLSWMSLAAAGFLQWFVALPWIIQRLKSTHLGNIRPTQ